MTAVLLLAVVTLAVLAWRRLRRGDRKPLRRGPALAVVAALLGMQALIGTPAFAAPTDCAPNPERPGSGMVGALDPAPLGTGQAGSVYDEVAYAGLTWHLYDPNCGAISSMSSPSSVIDTWLGNELFNITKVIVGATNGLHYALLGPGGDGHSDLVKPLDDLVATGTSALYNSVFAPFLGLAALGLAIMLFRQIWRGDMAAISKKSMWALAALWLASATYLTPLIYTQILDKILIFGTSQLQAGFLKEVKVDERNALPTMLYDNVIYRNWLRGEFGSPDAPQSQQFGRDLVRAQAFSKQEITEGKDSDPNNTNAKKQAYVDLRGKLGNATGYFDGSDGSRTGDGFLALFQALVFALFQLLAKVTILLAQVLLRVMILAGPIIGLAALLYHDLLRKIGRAAGASLLNVVIISCLAGLHTLVLSWIFDPAHSLPLLTQMLLAGLVTVALFMVGKPVQRMVQMVQLSVGAAGGVRNGFLDRLRGRKQQGPTAQDAFWEHVREGDHTPPEIAAAQRGGRRYRPEAHTPVLATSQRLDRTAGALESGGGVAALPAASGRQMALVAGETSRLVDSPSVIDRSWDRRGEDAVIVPSQADRPVQEPRRAETEVVAGRQVHVIFRPSRGLEVAENEGPSYGWGERRG
ncbi:hypothetical protein GCM10010174_20880 [Kutzneria viridogrisea]|uniref:Uncharacterized protein n=2 Tax=Kutzneria TaxID=43356 RepID=W5W0S2_9PSEU|nr:hypothetical protein [Kutzneria albida]AHH94437.1 hypothetical protein KALB_1064 [Kutzneria albida DSM 43870]MBA8930104.1 hypothetical protein [Kutzneria viridogrisea]